MGLVGAAFEFGMELHAHKEGLAGELHGLHRTPVRGENGEAQPGALERSRYSIVYLSMTIPSSIDIADPSLQCFLYEYYAFPNGQTDVLRVD